MIFRPQVTNRSFVAQRREFITDHQGFFLACNPSAVSPLLDSIDGWGEGRLPGLDGMAKVVQRRYLCITRSSSSRGRAWAMRPSRPVMVWAEVRAFMIDSSTASAVASKRGLMWSKGSILTSRGSSVRVT